MRETLRAATAALLLASGCSAPVDAETPFHVMVVNDDGIDSPGLVALAGLLVADERYRVTVVAPAEQQSGVGHAIVIGDAVALSAHAAVGGAPAWSVDATPASVTAVGLTVVLDGDAPGLVVSGINRGENLGRAAWYSGTIAAAREAALRGIPAIALSLELDWSDPQPDWAGAARLAKPIIDAIRESPPPPDVLLNVNLPRDTAAARGYRITRLGLAPDAVSRYEIDREADGIRYLSSRWAPPAGDEIGTDIAAIGAGFVPVTPLGLDQTSCSAIAALAQLEIEPPPPSP